MAYNTVRQRAAKCISLLEELYGIPQAEERDPVDLLVMTILSQNTSDTNSLRAFARLKSTFSDYEQVLAATDEAVAESIRAGGLAEIKARRTKEALFRIKQDAETISLSFLADMKKEQAMAYLLSLPGVGPKTASVVLLFAFFMPFLPVDTHVYRICRRLGLVGESVALEKAQSILERVVPVDKYLSFHLNLITHGRRICRARNPRHEVCPLQDCCDYYLHGQKP
ncbi:MAG: endonuclease III [Methanothrix sp.]|nr:endonuclease III [Methanothrix sp.]